jgi:predicted DNA-binding transcriptional regulator AlpA
METKLKPPGIIKPTAPHRTPADLADLAFLDIRDVCAAARMSASWIHDEVRARRFPQPMRFGPRCTRWRSSDVREWLVARAAAAEADIETGALLTARAKKASDAAQAKRRRSQPSAGDSK